jgi:hypothetical protein
MVKDKGKNKHKGRGRRTDLYLMVDRLRVRQLLLIHTFHKSDPIGCCCCRDRTGSGSHIISRETVLRADQELSLPATVPAKKSIRGSRSAGWFTIIKPRRGVPMYQSQ